MIYVTSIYDDEGQKIGEVSRCDHKPLWLWRDVWLGLAIALVAASQIFA